MIALAEEKVDVITTSRSLENLILSDMPVPFLPEKQYVLAEDEGEKVYYFLDLPKKRL